jgi:hypothetical protein
MGTHGFCAAIFVSRNENLVSILNIKFGDMALTY